MKKITTNTKTLSNAVAIANTYTSKEGDYAGAITLVGNDGMIEVKATDMMQTMVFKNIVFTSDDLTDPNFDAISLDGKKLATVLKVAKSDEVIIEINDDFIVVKSNRSRVKIEIHAKAQEITVVKDYGEKLELSSFVDSMESLFHAIDINNPKYELNGMLMQAKEGLVSMVATDTRRLAAVSKKANVKDLDIIIPKQAISTIIKHFNVEDVVAEADDVMLTVDTAMQSYSTKLINGKFPDYQRIMPVEFSHTINLSTKSLAEVVEEASMFESDILISIKNQTLCASDLSKNTEAFSQEDETIDDSIEIFFAVNAKYVLEFISSIEAETIELCFNAHNVPFVLKAVDHQEVIMPIILPDVFEDDIEKAA